MTVFQSTGQHLIKEQQLQHDHKRIATTVESVGKTALVANIVFLALLIVLPKSLFLFQAVAIALPLIGTLTVAPWVLIALGVLVLGLAVIGIGAFGEEISNAVIRLSAPEHTKHQVFAGSKHFTDAFNYLLEDEEGDWEGELLAFIDEFEGDENKSVFFKRTKDLLERVLWINTCGGYEIPLTDKKIARVEDGIRRVLVFLEDHEREEGKTRLTLEKYNPEVPSYKASKAAKSLSQAKGFRVGALITGTVTSVALSVLGALASTGVSTLLATHLITPIIIGSIGVPAFIPIVAAIALSALIFVAVTSRAIAVHQKAREKFSAREVEYSHISQYITRKPMQTVENYLIKTAPSRFSQIEERMCVSQAITSDGLLDAQKLAALRQGLKTLKKTVHLDHQSIGRIDHLLEQLSPLTDSILPAANQIISGEDVETSAYQMFFALNWLGLVDQEQSEDLMEKTHMLITIETLPALIQQLHLVPDQTYSILIYKLVQEFVDQPDVVYQLTQNTKDSLQVSSLLEAMLMNEHIQEHVVRELCRLLLEKGVTDEAEERYLQMVRELPYNVNFVGREGNTIQSNIPQAIKILSCLTNAPEARTHAICELAHFARLNHREKFLTLAQTLLLAIENPIEQQNVIAQLLEESHVEEYCALLSVCIPKVPQEQKESLLQMVIEMYQGQIEKLTPILETIIPVIPQNELLEILTAIDCPIEIFDQMVWIMGDALGIKTITALFAYMGEHGQIEHVIAIGRTLTKSAYPTQEFANLLVKLCQIETFAMNDILPIFLQQRKVAVDTIQEECISLISHFCTHENNQAIGCAVSILREYDVETQTHVIVDLIHRYTTNGHRPFFKKILGALIERFTETDDCLSIAIAFTLNEVKTEPLIEHLFDLMSKIPVKQENMLTMIKLLLNENEFDNVKDLLEFCEFYVPKQWQKEFSFLAIFQLIDESSLEPDECVDLVFQLMQKNNGLTFAIGGLRWICCSERLTEDAAIDLLFKIYANSEDKIMCLHLFKHVFSDQDHFNIYAITELFRQILNSHPFEEKEEVFLWMMDYMAGLDQENQEIFSALICEQLSDDLERIYFLMRIFPQLPVASLFENLIKLFPKEDRAEIRHEILEMLPDLQILETDVPDYLYESNDSE